MAANCVASPFGVWIIDESFTVICALMVLEVLWIICLVQCNSLNGLSKLPNETVPPRGGFGKMLPDT